MSLIIAEDLSKKYIIAFVMLIVVIGVIAIVILNNQTDSDTNNTTPIDSNTLPKPIVDNTLKPVPHQELLDIMAKVNSSNFIELKDGFLIIKYDGKEVAIELR